MFHNFLLDAVLFVLFTARYLWGPAADMLRMILFLFSSFAVVADMNLYYGWEVPWLSLSLGERQVFGKAVIGAFIVLDLLKDYMDVRRRERLRQLISTATGG